MQPGVATLIVNFNAGDALARCVESVLSQGCKVSVTVVDNASSDGSAKRLDELYGRSNAVEVICNDQNTGFSRAVNQAAEAVRDGPESYLLVLNPDCELFPGSLRTLVEALESNPEAALAGPAVVDRHGAPMRGSFRRFPTPWRSFLTFSGLWRLGRYVPAFAGVEPAGEAPLETTMAEAVTGACLLLRKERFFEIGGMDEGYALHCEDLDLMYRLAERGQQRLYVPAARVYHLQGLSSRSRPAWVHWQKHRGMRRFYDKFQAADDPLPLRWLVRFGIAVRFLLTLPLVLLRR